MSSSGSGSSGDAGAAPAQAQDAGFNNLVFNATFSTLSLSNTGTGAGYTWYNPGVWYESPASGASTPTNAGGVLNLPWNPGQSGDTTVGTMASNGLNNTSWLHGYVEVSLAFPPVTGIWPAIWMENNAATTSYVPIAANTHHCGELDIVEWQSQTPNVLNGTIHDWSGSPVSDVQNNGGANTANFPAGVNLANYNIYGVLWTETKIDWYFNNQLMITASATNYPAAFATFNASPMYLMLTNQPGSDWGSGPGPSAATDVTVQWVHVWQ